MRVKRLLIITQKVDKNDPMLGFLHGWLEEFAKHLEKIEVICLCEGSHALPANVSVYSLGKESGYAKLRQLWRFWKLCWQLTPYVDGVFVHMNAIYVPLGWPIWKLYSMSFPPPISVEGKLRRESRPNNLQMDPRIESEDDKKRSVFLWRNHPEGGWLACLAYSLADKIFYTSPHAHAARFPKSQQMPAGIDTEFFCRDGKIVKNPNSLLCLGRISPVKRLETVIEAVHILDQDNIDFTLTIVGSPVNPEDAAYEEKLHTLAGDLVAKGLVRFKPGISPMDTPKLYNEHEIFINTTPTGSYDKTVLEAMACEAIVITSNVSFADMIPAQFLFEEGSGLDLAEKITRTLQQASEEKLRYGAALRRLVQERHGLSRLVQSIFRSFII